MDRQIAELTEISTRDFLGLLGLAEVGVGRGVLARLCRPVARRFARRVAAYDRRVGAWGLRLGAAWVVRRFCRRLEVAGLARVPHDGPLLIAANHPGLTDTVSLFAALPRDDLRIIAADRPFLRALPHTYRRLLVLDEAGGSRLPLLRAAAGHLRAGGSLLTFPAGTLEPDPARRPGAANSLRRWLPGLDRLARLAPQTRLLPAAVSGVLAASSYHHPLARLHRNPDRRADFAAGLQLCLPAHQGVVTRIAFGRPIDISAEPRASLMPLLLDQMADLIQHPPTDWTTVVDGLR